MRRPSAAAVVGGLGLVAWEACGRTELDAAGWPGTDGGAAGIGSADAGDGSIADTSADAIGRDGGPPSHQSPRIIFSRGCLSGGGGLFIARPDGRDERMLFPPGHSLKPEMVYETDRLLVAVESDLYTVSLTTSEATRLMTNYAIGSARPAPGPRWTYAVSKGDGWDLHVLDLQSLQDVDLGLGSTYCGSMANEDIVYSTPVGSSPNRQVFRYDVRDGSSTQIDSALNCSGVLPTDRIYFPQASATGVVDLYIIDAGGQSSRFLCHGWDGSRPVPLPDGRLLVASSSSGVERDYLAIDPDTGAQQPVFASSRDEALRGGVSATGRSVFLRYPSSPTLSPELWSVRYDGSNPIQLDSGQGVPRAFPGIDVVTLTPTARVVYFRTRQDSDLDLFSIPDVGGEAALLGTTQSSVGNVALLSDDRLVFVRDGTLSAVSLDGTDGSVLVSTPGWKQIEQIFPDGRILFESVVGAQDTDLFVVTPDGAGLWPIGQTSDCEAFALLAP